MYIELPVYIEFKRSGDITYNCYGSGCCVEPPKRIGEWCDTVYQMLDSDQFALGNNLDAALLRNLETFAITPGKTIGARYANVRSMDFLPKLEEVVTTYLSRYSVFVSNPSVYVKQYWEDDQVQEFKEYSSDKLRNVVKPYILSFDMWNSSRSSLQPSRRSWVAPSTSLTRNRRNSHTCPLRLKIWRQSSRC